MELEFKILDWFEVHDLITELFVKLQKLRINPQMIVGIAKGGWIPARLLVDFYKIEHLSSIGVKYYEKIGKRHDKPILKQFLDDELQNKDILLVDDLVDSGESMKLAVQELKKRGIQKLTTATLYQKRNSIFTPTAVAKVTSKWIVFPWEYFEFMKEFAESSTKAEIKNLLETLKAKKISNSVINSLASTYL